MPRGKRIPIDESKRPTVVEFGSEEHRAILGIDLTKDPARRAELEEQLAAKPFNHPKAKGKMPIGKAYNEANEPIPQAEDFYRRAPQGR